MIDSNFEGYVLRKTQVNQRKEVESYTVRSVFIDALKSTRVACKIKPDLRKVFVKFRSC